MKKRLLPDTPKEKERKKKTRTGGQVIRRACAVLDFKPPFILDSRTLVRMTAAKSKSVNTGVENDRRQYIVISKQFYLRR